MLPVPTMMTPPSAPEWAPVQAARASVVKTERKKGLGQARAIASRLGSLAPANARHATIWAFGSRPAWRRHASVASCTAAKLSAIPNRILAGPATPSPKRTPSGSQRRARQRVPPPSTPNSRTSCAADAAPTSCTITHENRSPPNAFFVQQTCSMETEHPSPRFADIDLWEPTDVLEAMIGGQFTAVASVRAALPDIACAALAMEARLREGGRLVYVGAGTSGRLAVQDGAELMPTFGWPSDRLVLIIAGGEQAMTRAIEGAETRRNRSLPSCSITAWIGRMRW